MSEKKKICLNMIVKNEAHVIESVLECMSKYIDYYIISDTGSTDNTKEIIKNYFDNIHIEGEIFDDEWKNFGYNRSKALEHCRGKVDYCWVIDADDIIVGDLFLPEKMDKDSYNLTYGKDFCYRRKQIFKVDKNWKYVGVLHEYPKSEDNSAKTEDTIEGNYYIDSRRLGDRNKNPDKYKKDCEVLLKGLEEEPNNDRYHFYLAQSYMDDHQYEKSNEYYLKRFNMGGWVEEQYFSLFKIGENNIKLKKNKEIIIESLLRAFKFRPSRLEALYELVNYLFYNEENKDIPLAAKYAELGIDVPITNDVLFVSMYLYEHKFLDVASLAFFYNQEFYKSVRCINIILDRQKYPLDQLSRYEKNRGFCIPHIVDKLIQYPDRKIDEINNNIKFKFAVKILFTITTCKRIDLFINTMNSFINNCKDIDLIDKFICIDDNSSNVERKLMKQKYPFIDFIYKGENEKGHCISMNKILDLVELYNVKYLIHLEDDWNFYGERKYIIDSIKIIENTINIKQVLFNKNYAELYDDHSLNIAGGIQKNVANINYIEHEHYKENTPELRDFYIRNAGKNSCAYWPHFSFRPSLIDCKIFKKIGKYRTSNGHFEIDYSHRFYEKGYKAAFFQSLSCYHTGKLTSETSLEKPNAYNLNNVCQFTAKENITLDIKKKSYIRILNLKRREDRKNIMIERLKEANIDNYDFIEAVDGENLEANKTLEKLFRDNDFGSRRGVIGCALSHYNLWKELLEDDDYNYYIIMEDDIQFCNDFKKKLDKIKNQIEEKEFLFFGYSMFDYERQEIKKYNETDTMNIEIQNLNRHIYIGGYFTYSINKIGAKKLIHYIKNNGIKHGIDYLNKIVPNIDNYEVIPQLTFTSWNEGGKIIDSDIQNNYESIDFSVITKSLDQFIFIPDKDIIGHDISHANEDIYELANIAIENDKCIGFNTAGFFKDTITYLQESIYFKEGDGIYIKKNIYEKNQDILHKYIIHELEKEFVFISSFDWGDNDIMHHYDSLPKLFEIANNNEECVAFNTLGFFKNYVDINNLTQSPYFSNKDGIYIKKKYYNKIKNNIIRVKMLCNWCNSKELCSQWSNMCEKEFMWKNIEITWENSNIDYYVIINKPPHDEYYLSEKTILFQMEPWISDLSKNWGVKTWGYWSEPPLKNFLAIRGRKTECHNNAFWQLELNYNEIKNLEYDDKFDKLSSICSSLYFDEGHIKRVDFLKFLEEKGDIDLDIYGYDNDHSFTNYRGPLHHYVDKSKGIIPYKYYFMMENNFEKNFITEKIWEPIICESLVFYYGCSNLDEYINKDAYVLLDINDFEKSYNIIKKAIQEDWWSKRIDIIKQEKLKILDELGFFPVIKNIIDKFDINQINILNDKIPILIICYNNYRYVENTIQQINAINSSYNDNIIIINNNSNDSDTIDYLEKLKKKSYYIINNLNISPRIDNINNVEIFNKLPDKFILTDPDLQFNKNIPKNFIDDLITISEKYKSFKTGFALDISDYNCMYQHIYTQNKNIYDWEKVNWYNSIPDEKYILYDAGIDTTFSLINKNYLNNDNRTIRIAGDFTAKHLPWYIKNNIYSLSESYTMISTFKDDISDTKNIFKEQYKSF